MDREPRRELRSDIFVSESTGPARPEMSPSISSQALAPRPSAVQRFERNDIEAVVRMDAEMESMRLYHQQNERRIEQLAMQLAEIVKVMQARFERTGAAIRTTEEVRDRRLNDISSEILKLKGRVAEHLLLEKKVEELLERHNTLVKNFENRLAAQQRVIAQQELALHNANATINEIRMQLARK